MEYSAIQAFGFFTNYFLVFLYPAQLGLYVSKAYQLWSIFATYNQSMERVILKNPRQFLVELSDYMRIHAELCSLTQLGDELFGWMFLSTVTGNFVVLMTDLYTLSKVTVVGVSATVIPTLLYWSINCIGFIFIISFFSQKVLTQVCMHLLKNCTSLLMYFFVNFWVILMLSK
jgi:hypothetical protein